MKYCHIFLAFLLTCGLDSKTTLAEEKKDLGAQFAENPPMHVISRTPPAPGVTRAKARFPGNILVDQRLVWSWFPVSGRQRRQMIARLCLTYALELGHNRRKWTDRTGGLKGYDTWIRAMETGIAGRFGLGYNAAVWAESRRFAVQFLKEAQERLDNVLKPLFTAALGHYKTVAQNLNAVSDKYPFKECEDERIPVDEYNCEAVEALKRARDAEVAGLNVLAELINRLT